MSSSNTPGLQVRSRRDNSTRAPRPQRPSGPGVRWRLTRDVIVRFSADMTRVHLDNNTGRRNLVQLRYRTTMRDRPSDVALATLLSLFTTVEGSSSHSTGHRCWILQQQTDGGWTLALDVRNGRDGSFVLPGVDQGKPLGMKLDLENLRAVADLARTLWRAADESTTDPTKASEVSLAALKQLMGR